MSSSWLPAYVFQGGGELARQRWPLKECLPHQLAIWSTAQHGASLQSCLCWEPAPLPPAGACFLLRHPLHVVEGGGGGLQQLSGGQREGACVCM